MTISIINIVIKKDESNATFFGNLIHLRFFKNNTYIRHGMKPNIDFVDRVSTNV